MPETAAGAGLKPFLNGMSMPGRVKPSVTPVNIHATAIQDVILLLRL